MKFLAQMVVYVWLYTTVNLEMTIEVKIGQYHA